MLKTFFWQFSYQYFQMLVIKFNLKNNLMLKKNLWNITENYQEKIIYSFKNND